jgi:hypothetical protein
MGYQSTRWDQHSSWEAIDAADRSAGGQGWVDLVRAYRPMPEPPRGRIRLEMPVLMAWLILSGLWPGLWSWLGLGAALVAFSLFIRGACREYHLPGQAGLYRALGLGQMATSLSFAVDFGPLWPLVGLYWAGVVLAWLVLEFRHLARLSRQDAARRYRP